MNDQCALATAEKEIFSSPQHPFYFQADQHLPQVERNRPSQIRVSYRDSGDLLSFETGNEIAPDDFDFGKLRQVRSPA